MSAIMDVVIGYENHPNDSRVTESGDISQTLSSRMGTGGGNCPIVLVCKNGRRNVCCGYGRRKEFVTDNRGRDSDTLHNARRRAGNTGKEEAFKIKRLWAGDGDKLKPRSDYNGRKGGNGFGLSDENVSYTLTAVDRHMVFYVKEQKTVE